jgi:hypothetical protein
VPPLSFLHFYFSLTTTTIKKSKQPPDQHAITTADKNKEGTKKGLAEVAVQWLNQALSFYSRVV